MCVFPVCVCVCVVVRRVCCHVTDSGMLGGWWLGGSPSSPDSNLLRVHNAFPNRRLSDNTLMTPKIRVAPSCASSPGGTPGSSGGLPIRRHSSIGPQERRGSHVNLSPPTVSILVYLHVRILGIIENYLFFPSEWHNFKGNCYFSYTTIMIKPQVMGNRLNIKTLYIALFYDI